MEHKKEEELRAKNEERRKKERKMERERERPCLKFYPGVSFSILLAKSYGPLPHDTPPTEFLSLGPGN